MVVVPTGKIDLGPAWAAAAPGCAAEPASASAPVAKMVLRSISLMGASSLFCLLVRRLYSVFATKGIPFALCCVAIAAKRKARVAVGLSIRASGEASVLDLGRQLATVGGQLGHDLLVQPDIHAGGIVAVARVAKFLRELLACRKARIDVERLHQVDDRGAPLQLLALGLDGLIEDGCDVDSRSRCRSGSPRRSARGRSGARGRAAASRRGVRLGAEDRAHDFSENAHRSLPMKLKSGGAV